MWVKRTRITLLVALLLAVAVLSWLAANPQIYAGHLSRLLTRNLLRQNGISFRYQTAEGNVLGEMRLLNVNLSWQGREGSFAYLQADTLEVSYDLTELLRGKIHAYRMALLSARGTYRQGAVELPPSKPRSSGRTPPVAVEEAVIRNLQLRWIHPDGREEKLEEINWWGGVRRQGSTWVVDSRSLSGRWPTRRIAVSLLRGRVEVQQEGLHFIRLRASTDSTQVEADGWFRKKGGFDVQVDAPMLRLGEILRILGKPSPISADLAGEAHLTGLKPLEIEGSAQGQVAGYAFSDARLKMRIEGSRLVFSRVDGKIFGAPAWLRGTVDTRSKEITLAGRVERLDLSRRWVPENPHWPASRLSGRVELELDLDPPVKVDLKAAGIEGEVAGLPVDSLRVRLSFQKDRGARFQDIHGRIHQTWFDGSGTLDSLGVLDLPFTALATDLSSWKEAFRLPFDTARGLRVQGRFRGPGTEPALFVEGVLEEVDGFHLSAKKVRGRVRMDQWDDLGKMRGSFKAQGLALDDRDLGRMELEFRRADGVTHVPRAEISQGDTVLTLSAEVIEGRSSARVLIDTADFRLGSQTWRLVERSEGTIGKGWARTRGLHLRSESGEWTLRGGVDSLGVIDLDIDLTRGDLSLLAHLGQGPPDLGGTLQGSVKVSGTASNPHLLVDVTGEDLSGFGRALDRVTARVEVKGRQVEVGELDLRCPQGILQAQGHIDLMRDDALHRIARRLDRWKEVLASARPSLTIHLEDFNSRYWADPSTTEEDLGRAAADLTVKGSLQTPRIQGEIEIDDYLAGGGTMTIPSLRAWMESDGSFLRLSSGVLSAPEPWLHFSAVLPLRLSFISPSQWVEEEGVEVELSSPGEVELKPLANIVPHLAEVSGRAEILYRAQGPMSHPRLEGYLKVRDGVAQLEQSLERVREIDLEATLDGSTWTIDHLTGREGMKGKLEVTGAVVFKGLLPDDIDLDIRADRFLFASYPHLRALLRTKDFHMSLKRPGLELARRPYFSGTVEVIKARYTGEFASAGEEGGLVATTAPSWLADIHLKARRTVRVRNNTADLLLEGDVDLVRDLDGLRFTGVVEIPQGRVVIFNNDFDIVSGTLDYSRARGLEPAVEIEARTRVPDVRFREAGGPQLEEVRVYLTGTFSNLKTRFESDSSYDEETIVRLLAGFSEEPGKGSLADTGFKAGLNYIERSIAREIKGIDTLDIETESASISEASRTRVAVGKYLSSDLYLRYSQGLSISERELFLEYQMTRTLRLSSELGTRLRSGVPTTTFNVELKYRVEY